MQECTVPQRYYINREGQSLSKKKNLCGLPHRPWENHLKPWPSLLSNRCFTLFLLGLEGNQAWTLGRNPIVSSTWTSLGPMVSTANYQTNRRFGMFEGTHLKRTQPFSDFFPSWVPLWFQGYGLFVTMMWMDPKTVWPINLDIVEAGAKQDIATKDTNNNLHLSHLHTWMRRTPESILGMFGILALLPTRFEGISRYLVCVFWSKIVEIDLVFA